MSARHRRMSCVAGGVASAALACALVLDALRANVMFFVSPSQMLAAPDMRQQHVRLGGLVERGTLSRDADGRTVRFVVTDRAASIAVVYAGALPDLFREGSGVVAQGTLGADGRFHADEVLAKHDEKYRPPAVDQALRAAANEAGAPR
jgi:cytochrome c-type biogenesis protein CcmE